MIRRKIGHLVVASTFVLAMLGAGASVALATDTTRPGPDLANDFHAGQHSPQAGANRPDTADEGDEDGDVDEVEVAEVHVTDVAEVPERETSSQS